MASDGTARNSPFTTAFLKHVGTPNLDLRHMLFRVQDEVDRATEGKQRPELAISLVGEFKLKPALPSGIDQSQQRPSGDDQGSSEAAQAWAAIKDTTNRPVLEAFIRRFGNTFYADIARARLEELNKAQIAIVRPEPPTTLPQPSISDPRFSIINASAVKGEDYARIENVSAEGCLNHCAGDSRCKMFAYWRNRTCYLFDQSFGTYPNLTAQVGRLVVERPSTASNVSSRPISVTRGLAVRGEDYLRLGDVTFEHCSKQCAENMRCKMFTYWNNRTCYLFDQDFATYPTAAAQLGKVRP